MQLYVLDRAKNTLATTASFYNDKHHKELTAGASIFEFTIDKSDSAAQHMTTGNYLVFQDDRGRAWSFTILSYDETQTTKTVAAEDVSIELLNKAMDVWNTDQAYPFSYYFDLITKGTPWKLGVNQLTDLSRKLIYTGRDTGLGRLLSVLKGFDNAECQFNIKVQQNKPVEFVVDVYKSIGTVQDNIQIVYNNELNDIKKTESRAQFVTALAGVGGLVENQATTDPGLEKHIDFTDIDYKDDNFVSPKGDKFLRAVTANRTFNPGTTTYIEDFYDYDTQSAQELLNRTLTQLKERSEPQYTYDADVKIIDPTLDIGDTVTIIDHDYNPALYLQARVATLDKSYTDPTQGAITFCNYRLLNSSLSDQLRAMQNIIDQMPTSESVKLINSNIIKIIATNEELKQQVTLALKSADGKSTIYFDAKPSTAQDGDIAFIKNADGATEIWKFVDGAWKLDIGLATFEDVKKAASAAADAGSQAVVAGQQASAAGADAKSAGDFAASAASQATIETAAAQSAANSAVDQANLAVSQAGFANNAADQAKSAAASAQSDAADALGQASTAIANASTAINTATDAQTKTNSLVTKVNDIAGTIETLATTETVNKLAGTVTTVQNLAQFASDGLKLKADTTTVDQINGTVNDLKGELDVQADKIAATVTASDVTGMLGNYATQSWSEGKISAAKNEITTSVQNITSDMATQTWTQGKLDLTADGLTSQISSVKNGLNNLQVGGTNLIKNTSHITSLDHWRPMGWAADHGVFKLSNHEFYKNGTEAAFEEQSTAGLTYSVGSDRFLVKRNTDYIFQIKGFNSGNLSSVTIYFLGRKYGSTNDYDADAVYTLFSGVNFGSLGLAEKSVVFHVGEHDEGYIRIDHNGTNNGQSGSLFFIEPKMSEGKVLTDYSPAPEDMATAVQFTSIEETLKGVQVTANNAVTQSQYTQLADQFTSTIGQISGVNLIPNSDFSQGNQYWNLSDKAWTADKGWKYTDGALVLDPSDTVKDSFIDINVSPNTDYTFSCNMYGTSHVFLVGMKDQTGAWTPVDNYQDNYHVLTGTDESTPRQSFTLKRTSAQTRRIRIILRAEAGTTRSVFAKLQLEEGTVAHAWAPSTNGLATFSQITQLQSDINLRVKTGDLISQINVSSEGILIDGRKVHITGDTTIDTGVIKTAMIADAAITNGKIANVAIDNAKIANASITAAKIADLAVGSAQIADGAISTAKIGKAAITSAQIADASILDAKIVSLDGSKIVAHSITADKLDVNAIAVGLNTYGSGWQITPMSIAFLPSASSTKASLAIGGTGIQFNDIGNGETLAMLQGTPYNTAKDTWYNGMLLDLSPNNDYVAMVDESATATTKFAWSRSDKTDFGMYSGFNFYDHVHFNTIGPFDPDTKARLKCVRVQIGGRWATGFMNSNTNAVNQSGIAFTDDGATYFGRSGVWWNLYDILKNMGASV